MSIYFLELGDMYGVWLLMLLGNILAGFRPYGSEPPSSPGAVAQTYEYDQLEQVIKLQCRNVTGNDNAFQDLMSYRNQSIVKCIKQYVKCPEPMDYKISYPYEEKFTICGRIVDCIVPLVEKIKPCLYDKDSVRIVQTLAYSLPEILKTMCDLKLFHDLFKPRFEMCIAKLALHINHCTYQIGNEWTTKAFDNYSSKECRELSRMRRCYYGMCSTRIFEKVFQLLYLKVRALTPCES